MGKFLTVMIYGLLAVILVFSAALVLPVYRKYVQAQQEVSELNASLDRSKAELLSLQQEVHDLEHKASAVEKVARENFRLCREGEQIYIYSE